MKVQLKEVVSADTAKWCRLPYPDHPKGCPNFDKKENCPPFAPLWNWLVEAPYYLVYQRFDLEAQEKKMLAKHPNWSKRQARCCLYWQRKIVKELLNDAEGVRIGLEYDINERFIVIENPEGAGVDLFETCRMAGIQLERDYLHQKYVYKMVIVAKRLK